MTSKRFLLVLGILLLMAGLSTPTLLRTVLPSEPTATPTATLPPRPTTTPTPDPFGAIPTATPFGAGNSVQQIAPEPADSMLVRSTKAFPILNDPKMRNQR